MILGIGDATTAAIVGPVVVAFVGVIGAAIRLGFKVWDELADLRRDQERRIGTPNGHGNVVEMSEKLLAGQAGQDSRLAVLERESIRQAAAQKDQGERLGLVEQEVALLRGAPCLTPSQEDDR